MIFFIYGPDTYRSRQKLAQIREQFDKSGLSTVMLNSKILTTDEFRKTVYSPSLFSEKRVIIIERLLAETKDKDLIAEIIDFLKKTKKKDEENVVIFWEEDFKENQLSQELAKMLTKEKYVYVFNFLSNSEVETWIRKEVVKMGGKIESSAVRLLANFVGSDLWRAKGEIDKLLAYETLISHQAVVSLVASPLEEKIWLFVNALAEKNKKRALKLLSDQIATGSSFGYLVTMLARQLRIIFSIKEVLEKFPHLNYQKIAEKLRLHPYVCQKVTAQIKNYQFSEIKKIYQNLVEIDLKSKISKVDPEILLDLLIISL